MKQSQEESSVTVGNKYTILSLQKSGVYCLANDKVLEWFQAFVRSFRKSNPELPLTVIPYNREISRLQLLQTQFSFDLMEEDQCNEFDSLADKVMHKTSGKGMLRKFCCFFGKYHNFIYLDSDIVVTMPLDRVLSAFAASEFDFVYFDTSENMCYDGCLASKMKALYGTKSFNAGAFISRMGALHREDILTASEKSIAMLKGFAVTYDEPFLNYVVDVNRLQSAHINVLLPDLSSAWVGKSFRFDSKRETAHTSDGKLLPFIHWAGRGYPTMERESIFLHYRVSGLSLTKGWLYKFKFHLTRWITFGLLRMHWWKWKTFLLKALKYKVWRRYYAKRLFGMHGDKPL